MAKNLSVKAIDASGKVKIYSSAAEAARALHIDPSNIGKVLSGKRKTAGGFSFVPTLEAPTTNFGKRKRRQQREATEHNIFVSQVHDRLKELNQRYRNALREGVYKSDPVLQKLMSHTDYFGTTKTGGYNISISNLKKFSTSELENLLKVLRTEEKKYVEIAERKKRPMSKAALAATFGISEEQVNQYDDILPIIFDFLHLAREEEFFKYHEVQTAIYEAMQAGTDPDKLLEYIDMMYEAYWGNDREALDAIIFEMSQVDEEYRDGYND